MWFKRFGLSKRQRKEYREIVKCFDHRFYLENYPDVRDAGLDPVKHYILYGWKEGRDPSPNFSTRDYLAENPSVRQKGINPFYHHIFHQKSGGFQSTDEGSGFRGLPGEDVGAQTVAGQNRQAQRLFEINYDYFRKNNSSCSELSNDDIDGLIFTQSPVEAFRIFSTSQENSEAYTAIALSFEAKGQLEKAFQLYLIALDYEENSKALEHIGNCYFVKNQFRRSQFYYEEAVRIGGHSEWVLPNLAKSYLEQKKYHAAMAVCVGSLIEKPVSSHSEELLRVIARNYWMYASEGHDFLAAIQKRTELIEETHEYVRSVVKQYSRYLETQGVVDMSYKDVYSKRVGIIGDFHVPQCIRYRINQKVEQLNAFGMEVSTASWTNYEDSRRILFDHHVLIFYRVPALPQVIDLIMRARALGKVVIYEIDDLIFDPVYPQSINSYGASVSPGDYNNLTRGMALFREAAKLCDYGIASTALLSKELGKLVKTGKCLVHRNGLDSLSVIEKRNKENGEFIHIFYGSGTLAHNADFIEIALPAISKILDEYKNVRFRVVGHLRLPAAFLEKYKIQVKQIPLLENIQDYWEHLRRADINLAVLHSDRINDCKSELKWIEAGCFQIPSVVSSTENYRDVIEDGVDGFIASTSDDWYEKIKLLVEIPELRTKTGKLAALRICHEYSVDSLGKKLLAGLNELVCQHCRVEAEPKRKKIALVNVFFPPQSIGGATRVVSDNFDELNEKYTKDYEICVFTSDVECVTPYQLSVYNYKGVRVYRSPILQRENMDWYPEDPEMYNVFMSFLSLEKPDIIHFHCVQRLSASIVEAAKHSHIPYVVTVHDAWWISDFQFLVDQSGTVYPEGHPEPSNKRVLPNNVTLAESMAREVYLKDLLKGAKQVLAVSDAFSEIYRKNGITDIKVNKNGLSHAIEWAPKETGYTDKVVCAHIGGMSEHKGYYLLKQAIEKEQPDHVEILVVDHSRSEDYSQETTWGVVPVRFIGSVQQKNIVMLYQNIDVLFAPSIWPESYGLVTREAAACGCWVVASNMGGIGEDVVEGVNGFVVSPELATLQSVIREIDSHPYKYKRLTDVVNIRTSKDQVKELVRYY